MPFLPTEQQRPQPPTTSSSGKLQTNTGLELLQVDQLVQFFLSNAFAPTTLRSYQSAVKRYYNFCLAQNVTHSLRQIYVNLLPLWQLKGWHTSP